MKPESFEGLRPVMERFIKEEVVILCRRDFDDLENEVLNVDALLVQLLRINEVYWPDEIKKEGAIETLIQFRRQVSIFKSRMGKGENENENEANHLY